MRRPSRSAAAGLLLTLAAAACGTGGTPELSVSQPAVGSTRASSAAIYLELANSGDGDDGLVGASCACADGASLHLTESRGGIMIMQAADTLSVPAESVVELRPGGPHIMLEGLRAPLEEGAAIEVELEFSESPPMTVEVPVVPLESLAERVPEQ